MDQAAGLRALFNPRLGQLVPVVDNPLVAGSEGLLDALVGAYLERGLQVLVVDAGLRARALADLAQINLAACIETLSPPGDVPGRARPAAPPRGCPRQRGRASCRPCRTPRRRPT
jgi:hypothetical protein